MNFVFVHIPKTAGSAIERTLGIPFMHHTLKEFYMMVNAQGNKDQRRTFKKAFKFAFVRNPWDKTVSHYFYNQDNGEIQQFGKIPTFKEWMFEVYVNKNPKYCYPHPKYFVSYQYWMVNDKDEYDMDYVGKFENLEKDFEVVCRKLGIHKKLELPKVKEGKHRNKRDYRDFYDEETYEIVRLNFEQDILKYGYKFDK